MALTKLSPAPFPQGRQLANNDELNRVLANPAVSTTNDETATGTTAATAVPLTGAVTRFGTVAANTGALLAAMIPGQSQKVFNAGASTLTVYARSGYTVDGAASVSLSAAARCEYICIAPGVIISALLGAVSA